MEHALIETYGCTLNQADSDMIEGILRQEGVQTERGTYSEEMNADYVIINTCTVKKPTEQKILDRIQKMNGKGARLIVTGCMASANPDRIREAAPKARIISINNMPEMLPKMLNGNTGTIALAYKRIDRSKFIYTPTGVIARIPISDGCLSSCSFCETKFARGPLNSFSEELILRAVSNAVSNGAKEIELASQDTGAYGADKKTDIAYLVSKAADINGNFRIRIGMLNPEHLHKYLDRLIECYKSDKVYKFLHLPVQSGSDSVLKDMKRNYSAEEFRAYVREIREKIPGISIATDMIVGYPTETEEDFEMSINMLNDVRPAITNVSKFWERPNATAKRSGRLSNATIKERSIRMARLAKAIQYEDLSMAIGTTEKVCVTESNQRSNIARDSFYRNIALKDKEELGSEINVRITGNSSVCLLAERCS